MNDMNILSYLVENGGRVGVGGRAVYLVASDAERARAIQEETGLVVEMRNQCFALTSAGNDLFPQATCYEDRGLIADFVRHDIDHNSMTLLELLAALQAKGWVKEAHANRTTKTDPYVSRGSKTFHVKDGVLPFASYLRCLLQSKKLFKRGLPSLHHFQLESCAELSQCLLELGVGSICEFAGFL